MSAIAGFIVRGQGQAALVAASTLTLSLVFPPIVWLSNAAVALFVMRFGFKASAPMLAIAVIGSAALFWAISAHPALSVISAAVFWGPVIIAAVLLRSTESLELAILSIVGVALGAVLATFVVAGDPTAFWQELLTSQPVLQELMAQSGGKAGEQLLQSFAKLATGLMATGILLNSVFGLFLGRHWQAKLFQPGGFKQAFESLRLGKSVITAALLLCGLGLMSGSSFGFALAMPVIFLLGIQGMAVVHGVATIRKVPKLVLVMVYLALLVPHTLALVCVVALVDAWFDLRAVAARKA